MFQNLEHKFQTLVHKFSILEHKFQDWKHKMLLGLDINSFIPKYKQT